MTLKDIYEEPVFKSFTVLMDRYDTPQNQFWRYLQIRHLLKVISNPQETLSGPDTHRGILAIFGKRPLAPFFMCYGPVLRLRDGGQQFMRIFTWNRKKISFLLSLYVLGDPTSFWGILEPQARWIHMVIMLEDPYQEVEISGSSSIQLTVYPVKFGGSL